MKLFNWVHPLVCPVFCQSAHPFVDTISGYFVNSILLTIYSELFETLLLYFPRYKDVHMVWILIWVRAIPEKNTLWVGGRGGGGGEGNILFYGWLV